VSPIIAALPILDWFPSPDCGGRYHIWTRRLVELAVLAPLNDLSFVKFAVAVNL
jgi:hypothetical protein